MSLSGTADPKSARDHARAMAGARAEAMPTVPASEAATRPDGVPAEGSRPAGWPSNADVQMPMLPRSMTLP